MDVGFWLYGHWILVVWTLDLGCVDIGFWLYGRWILVVWTLDFDWVEVGFRLFERWIDVRNIQQYTVRYGRYYNVRFWSQNNLQKQPKYYVAPTVGCDVCSASV